MFLINCFFPFSKKHLVKMEKAILQHVPNFSVFASTNKPKLKTQYPFLSADQIKCKLKDLWNNLEPSEKQNYYKVTPTKFSKHEKKKVCATKQKVLKRKSCVIDPGNTPEYVNTKKLKDFRDKHNEKYENDFHGEEDMHFENEEVTKDECKTPTKLPGILKKG